jgi:hypothetical protein
LCLSALAEFGNRRFDVGNGCLVGQKRNLIVDGGQWVLAGGGVGVASSVQAVERFN